MLIQIESGTAKGARKVHVEHDDGSVTDFTAPSLGDAHKMIRAARKDGWDALNKAK
jgi:hypothetical protein